jgi:hypothetical protein
MKRTLIAAALAAIPLTTLAVPAYAAPTVESGCYTNLPDWKTCYTSTTTVQKMTTWPGGTNYVAKGTIDYTISSPTNPYIAVTVHKTYTQHVVAKTGILVDRYSETDDAIDWDGRKCTSTFYFVFSNGTIHVEESTVQCDPPY